LRLVVCLCMVCFRVVVIRFSGGFPVSFSCCFALCATQRPAPRPSPEEGSIGCPRSEPRPLSLPTALPTAAVAVAAAGQRVALAAVAACLLSRCRPPDCPRAAVRPTAPHPPPPHTPQHPLPLSSQGTGLAVQIALPGPGSAPRPITPLGWRIFFNSLWFNTRWIGFFSKASGC